MHKYAHNKHVRCVHSHSLVWIKISGTESTIWATAMGRILLARYLEGWRLDEGVIQVPGENKKLAQSATVEHLSKNAGGLKVLPPAARASSIKHLITWGEIYSEIIYSQMKFFQYEGQGPPSRGAESIWSAIKCQKRPICWYFYNITEWPQECHCCKCWGGLPNAPCWRTVEKKHYVHQNIHQISSPTTSPLIDFFIMLYKLYIGLGDVAIDGLPL